MWVLNQLFHSIIFSILLISMISIPIIVITAIIGTKIDQWLKRKYIEALIVDILITILVYEENNSDDWMKAKHKRVQLSNLEQAAIYIERYLPLQLRSGESATDTWLAETMMQVATTSREKKKWILTPKKDTRDNFLKSIATMLTYFVEGNWDALERREGTKLTPFQWRNAISRFLLKVLRTILLAILYPAVLFIIQQTPFAFTGAVYNTALYLLIFYEISVLATAINPNFSTTITNSKDIKSLWQ